MTDAEVIQAVEGWNADDARYAVEFEGGFIGFAIERNGRCTFSAVTRDILANSDPSVIEGVRIGLNFALTVGASAKQIAGGFSRS